MRECRFTRLPQEPMTSAQAIEKSPVFQKWRRAFHDISGIDIHLLGAESIEEDLHKVGQSLELCRIICHGSPQCALLCAEDRERFAKRLRTVGPDRAGPFAIRCFIGLTITALPVPLADGTTAFLSTGPILLKSSDADSPVDSILRRISANKVEYPGKLLREIVRRLPVCDRRKFKSTVTLLRLLAEQLSHMSRQMLATPENGWHDGVVVRRACELIDRRFTEKLRLDEVAHEIGVSRSLLSHLFHRHMGLTFTGYLAERRVIEMKRLLADSGLSVTETLFAAGFQSVSQANRVFRASTGMAPREFQASAKR